MSSAALPPLGNSLRRKLGVSLLFAATHLLAWHRHGARPVHDAPRGAPAAAPRIAARDAGMRSGVGLVTTDGRWDAADPGPAAYRDADIKILGFTDRHYIAIAKVWYMRLTILGYTEHYIVAYDELSFNTFQNGNYRVMACFIENPDRDKPVRGMWQQIMSARLRLTRDLLLNGTHLLVTDVDNVFSRHVPLRGFLAEGYDAYHAYEMRYPTHVHAAEGLVVCSGHQFLRASPATLRFLDLVLAACGGGDKCDDQVTYNVVIFQQLEVEWDGGIGHPNRTGALRVNATPGTENADLLVESVTGRSPVTNHTIKIWDRDFAWRLAGAIPEHCPSMHNWVGMPTKLDVALPGIRHGNKLHIKLAAFPIWDQFCRSGRYLAAP